MSQTMERIIAPTKKVLAVAAIACIASLGFTSTSTSASVAAVQDTAATYKSKCASCHGANGDGQTAAGKPLKLRDLRSAEVRAQSDDQLYAIIAKGKGKMPGYEKTLKADMCKALVGFIKQLK